ncbi:MAG: type II secretion system protein GspK [Pirellulales bacterium]
MVAGRFGVRRTNVRRESRDAAHHAPSANPAFADSGVELMQRFLLLPNTTKQDAGGQVDNAGRFQAQVVMDSEIPRERGRFTILSPKIENGEIEGVRYGVEDESTKLNLNTLTFLEQQQEGAGKQLLMALPGMTDQIADSILDYLDEDEEQRENGAESDYYTSLDPPYACRNGPFETIDELLLVSGVTPELLYGADLNRNGMIDENEQNNPRISDSGDAPPEADRGWSAFVTLYGVEANLKPDGTARINLNGDDMQILFDQVSTALNEKYATFIVAYRQFGPYTGTSTGATQTTAQLDFTKKGNTKINSVLDLIGAKVQMTNSTTSGGNTGGTRGGGTGAAAATGTVLESPFGADPGSMNGYLLDLLDNVTTNTAPTIPGRININQASSVILNGIPGMTPQIVESIIGAREFNAALDNPNQRYETWILMQGIVTLDEMKSLAPFICAGGSAYRAQVIGYFDEEGPATRVEAVVDTSSGQSRVVFWRELSHLGRGYPLGTLGTAAE